MRITSGLLQIVGLVIAVKTCEKQDLMSLLGVAMMPAWSNCSTALGTTDTSISALNLAVSSPKNLALFCATPACVENINELYKTIPDCIGPNGLNIQTLNQYTADILCGKLSMLTLTQSGTDSCTEVDLAVLEFLWLSPPWENCSTSLPENPMAMLMSNNSTQQAALCAAPLCLQNAQHVATYMPNCINNSTLQLGWSTSVGSNSKQDIQSKLVNFCTSQATSSTYQQNLFIIFFTLVLLIN